MCVTFEDIKRLARIDNETGKAVIPEYCMDESNLRLPDLSDFRDMQAVQNLYRRTKVLDAMNTIIRYANNEDISMGSWLYVVEDGAMGIEMAGYTDDEEFFEVAELFREIVSESELDDLVW